MNDTNKMNLLLCWILVGILILVLPALSTKVLDEQKKAAKERINYYLSKRVEDAFIIKVLGCTGTIISEDWVLSVAHCLDSYDWWGKRKKKNLQNRCFCHATSLGFLDGQQTNMETKSLT